MILKTATVCTGIGAPEVATDELAKEMGFEHELVFACEKDAFARKSYLENFTPKEMYLDMTTESWEGPKYYADLLTGGIPCQAFSLAGKRMGEDDPRGLLFFDFYRYVKHQQPKAFIIENVKGLLSDNKGITWQNWRWLLGRSENGQELNFMHPDSLEYNLHYMVLNSKKFGVPQNRDRIFLVGIRKDLPNTFKFNQGWRLQLRLKDILEPNVDEKYYLSEKLIAGYIKHKERHAERGNGFAFVPTDGNVIASAVTTKPGSRQTDNYIIDEPMAGRITGRDPDNPKARIVGQPHEQTLEVNKDPNVTNVISTVQKDNIIIEPQLVQVAQLEGFESEGRIYDGNGIARTIKNGGGGGAKTGWYLFSDDQPETIKTETGGGYAIPNPKAHTIGNMAFASVPR